jgi:hypothetical protein
VGWGWGGRIVYEFVLLMARRIYGRDGRFISVWLRVLLLWLLVLLVALTARLEGRFVVVVEGIAALWRPAHCDGGRGCFGSRLLF